jgi:hypothetical protein
VNLLLDLQSSTLAALEDILIISTSILGVNVEA